MLTVQNALVRSAAVEIRTLSLSGKQVTQAVFRQVPEAPILDRAGGLAGTPWGWVNYWWPDAHRWGEDALHVLWQTDDGQLRRACVPEPSMMQARHWNQGSARRYQSEPIVEALAALDKQAAGVLGWRPDRHFACKLPPFVPFGTSTYFPTTTAIPQEATDLAAVANAVLGNWRTARDVCAAAGQLFIAC